jgi:hypothetical protein
MSRVLSTAFVLFFLALLAAIVALYLGALRERPPEPAPAATPGAPAPPAPEAPGDGPEAPVEEKPLAITGRVVGAGLEGLEGVEVVCGAELAQSGADGRFELPERLRQGLASLSLRRDGEELARWQVIVGTAAEAGPGGARPLRSLRLRWSVSLLGGAAKPASAAGVPDPGPAGAGIVSLRAALVEEWGRSGVVHVQGEARLPDGAQLTSALYFGSDRIVAGTQPLEVFSGRFAGSYPLPESFHFYSAAYELHLFFDTLFIEPHKLERWRQDHPEVPWDALADFDAAFPIYVGVPEEELEDNRRIESYYRDALAKVDVLRKLLDRQFRETRRLTGGWDPALLGDRQSLRRAWVEDGAVDAGGGFAEAAWRAYLDNAWRPQIHRMLEEHARSAERKYPMAINQMQDVLRWLLDLSQMQSIVIYEELGLTPHQNDYYQDEYRPEGDAALLLQRLDENLKMLARYTRLTSESAGASPPRGESR